MAGNLDKLVKDYEVICISMYKEHLKSLDAIVNRLKKQGYTKVSRSQVLRFAIEHFDENWLENADSDTARFRQKHRGVR
jgi:hypothetical protein